MKEREALSYEEDNQKVSMQLMEAYWNIEAISRSGGRSLEISALWKRQADLDL